MARVLTDNGACYRSFAFRDELGEIVHKWTRPYRPQTNCEGGGVLLRAA